jgi:hypothetical protein
LLLLAGVQSSVQVEPSRINIAPWTDNSFAAVPPAPAAAPSPAIVEPALLSPNPAVQELPLPAPAQNTSAVFPDSPAVVVEIEPAGSNSSTAILEPVIPSGASASISTPQLTDQPAASDNSSTPALEPAALNTPSPAVVDTPAANNSSTMEPNSYETNIGLPAPASEEQQPADGNTTTCLTTQPTVGESTAPYAAAASTLPAVDVQPEDTSNGTSIEPSAPAGPTTMPASPAEDDQQQQHDDNTTVGWAVHPSLSNMTQPATSSSPLLEQQPQDSTTNTISTHSLSPSNAAAPTPSPEPADGMQGGSDNTTVTAAALPTANVSPQSSPAVDDLRGAAAAPNDSPTVADLRAAGDDSSNGESIAHIASVQDVSGATVEHIGLEGGDTSAEPRTAVPGQGGSVNITDLSKEGSSENRQFVTAAAVPNEAGNASDNDPNNDNPVHMAPLGEIPVTELVSIPYNRTS